MELKDFSTEQLEAEIERRKTQPEAPKLNLVRTNETGDKIFLVINNETHWVKNPETFQALGGDFAAVKTLPKEEFGVFVKGEDISLENVEKFK